jgi:hypothetical protein
MNASEIAVAAGTYLGLKDLAPRLLGSSADYLGEELKGLTQKGVQNLKRVFSIACQKLGPRIDSPGHVPPRVLRTILNEGYFADDQVTAEYLGGILASSRSKESRDDRGTYFAGIISRMSSYQIRSHYVLYQNFKHVFDGKRVPFNHMEFHEKSSISIPLKNYAKAMDCAGHEGLDPYLEHATVGLLKESLISPYFAHGESRFFRLSPLCGLEKQRFLGLVSAPSRLGLELFLWANGEGWQPVHQVFFSGNDFPKLPEVILDFTGVQKTPVAKEWGPEDEPASI